MAKDQQCGTSDTILTCVSAVSEIIAGCCMWPTQRAVWVYMTFMVDPNVINALQPETWKASF